MTKTHNSPKQVSLFIVKWKPKAGQPIPWEIKQKLCKPKGGRNKKGDDDNFHNRDYDFVSPDGEIFIGKGVRQFANEHGLNESALLDVLNGRVHSSKGWTKAVGGRKLPVPPTYYFLSPSGEIHTTTNLSEFARQHDLCPIALSRISRCLKATHRGWRHCTPDGQPIMPSDKKHRKFTLLSPTGEIIEGTNLKAFAEKHGLSRTCLTKVLDGTTKEHRGWKLPINDTMTTTAPNLGKLFNSRTSRPATPEDIALLAPGDWISERECPWSWQFKDSCQDMAVGVWEGKEFFVPHHLLMVCEIIEGQVIEKFFKKSEVPDLKTDRADLKVGDRVQHKVDPQGLGYSGVILEINEKTQSASVQMEDGHVHTFYIESLKLWLEPIKFRKGDRVRDTFPSSKGRVGVITKTSEQWSMVLWDDAEKPERWRHLEIAPKRTRGTDLGFKKGDRVRDTFNPRKPRIGTIADTPEKWAVIHWDGVKHSPNGQQWSYEHLEKIKDEKFFMNESDDCDSEIRVGDRVRIEALKAQAIFNNFRDELGGFTSPISESQIELIEGIGACYYHVRKDGQVTIRKLAVLTECQNIGWGRLLVYRVICRAIEENKTSVFLKCPDGLPSNNFYKKLGFDLETAEQGKNRPINHWRYHIKLPLLFYCGGGGKSKYDAIASAAAWNSGINSGGKNKAHHHMMMVDNSWKNYNHAQHLEMVRQNKPLIATARDIEHPEQLPEILEQAAELAQYVGRVLLIPKCDVTLPENYWLGYSVESKYGKTDLKPGWFGSRPVHLLGGSPKKQALLYPQMNVVSLDANYAMNLARNCKAVWSDGEKNIEQREQDCYQALALSLSEQFEFWRNGSLHTPPNIKVDEAGVVKNADSWNPADFGEVPHQIEASGQATIFFDDSGEPPEPDDFDTVEEFEEAWKQWENLQQGYCSLAVEDAHKAHLTQDIDSSGQLKITPTPQPSTESDSQILDSSNKILPLSPTNLSEVSTVSISLLGAAHAQISVLLENAPGLKDLADNCFLSSSNSLKSSSLQLFVGSKFQQSCQVEEGKTSSKSLMRLQRWGMWGLGKLKTETATFPKTENDYSVWVFTGDIRATLPKTGKKSLQEIFNGMNSVTGEEIDEAFTLTASTPKLGAGNKSHPNTFVSIPVKVYVDGVEAALESPALCVGGWQHRSPLHRDKRGADARRLANASLSFAVLYRAADGDRLYHEEAPTLRSLSNTGNHQSGNGAYKIREYQGETYLERPINATEAEQLMGWEVGSTAIGINNEGDEISISQTQRIKMIGNGIIPDEITDILTAIKPMLERKLESEVPENMRFAYRQLRQKGMSHQDALTCLI